jgi:hypothetical protein
MGTNTLNVKCDLNVEDAIAWNNYYLDNSPQWKKNWKLIRFVFMPIMAVCFALGVIYLIMAINKNLWSTFVAGGIGIIIGAVGLVYYMLYPKTLKRKIRKTAVKAYSYQNSLIGAHKYTVSAEGIHDNADALVKWSAVEDIVQNDTHVFILVNPKKALIIPKRAFPDTAAVDRFIQDAKAIFQSAQNNA